MKYTINFEEIMGLQVVTSGAHIIGEVKGAKIDTADLVDKVLECETYW